MTAIILAAGQGKRLRPLTNNLPKCMVSLGGQSLIHHQLETLCNFVDKSSIALVGGYEIAKLESLGVRLIENSDFETSNMVQSLIVGLNSGGVTFAEDLIITYGDIVYSPKLLEQLLANDAPVVVCSNSRWLDLWTKRMSDPLADAESFVVDENNRLIRIGEPLQQLSDAQGQYMGVIKIKSEYIQPLKDCLNHLQPTDRFYGQTKSEMYLTTLIQMLIDKRWDVRALDIQGGWLEVDTLEDLACYESLVEGIGLSAYLNSGRY